MIDEKALQAASAKLRKLRLTAVGGRKEHPAETVKSVFQSGLGGMYDDEAITYALRHGIQYYLAVQHSVHPTRGRLAQKGKSKSKKVAKPARG